jgi:hypothetical protein
LTMPLGQVHTPPTQFPEVLRPPHETPVPEGSPCAQEMGSPVQTAPSLEALSAFATLFVPSQSKDVSEAQTTPRRSRSICARMPTVPAKRVPKGVAAAMRGGRDPSGTRVSWDSRSSRCGTGFPCPRNRLRDRGRSERREDRQLAYREAPNPTAKSRRCRVEARPPSRKSGTSRRSLDSPRRRNRRPYDRERRKHLRRVASIGSHF